MSSRLALPCLVACALASVLVACPRREAPVTLPERTGPVTCPDTEEFMWPELPRPDAGTSPVPENDSAAAPTDNQAK